MSTTSVVDPDLLEARHDFQSALGILKNSEGHTHKRAAKKLCELSRSILECLWPPDKADRQDVDDAVKLFEGAVEHIQVTDRELQYYQEHIQLRLADLRGC